MACAAAAAEVPPATSAALLAGLTTLLAHEAAPLSTRDQAEPDVVQGILAPLSRSWVGAPRGTPITQVSCCSTRAVAPVPLPLLQSVVVFAMKAAHADTLLWSAEPPAFGGTASPWPLSRAACPHVHMQCCFAQAYDKIERATLVKIGAATQAAGEQLPEAASGREPSAAAAFAAARTGDLACLAVKQGLLLLGDSTLRQPALVRRFSSSVAFASQRVSDLLHRRYGGVSPPELISLFIAVRGHVHHQLSERWLFLEACCHACVCVSCLPMLQ